MPDGQLPQIMRVEMQPLMTVSFKIERNAFSTNIDSENTAKLATECK